jgi:hypothetical protein
MIPEKVSLREVAESTVAVQTARSEPIQQEPAPTQSMDFIRSLVLDLPVQRYKETPVSENMNIERMLETQLEIEARKGEKKDVTDHVSFDVPTLIRVFELVREGIKSDVELHDLVERLVALRGKGVLTMDDYDAIAGGNTNGTDRENDTVTSATPMGDTQNESLDLIKKLAGIR